MGKNSRFCKEGTFIKKFSKKFSSFNYFDGVNHLNVKSPRPMTLDEAMNYFNALAISGNE